MTTPDNGNCPAELTVLAIDPGRAKCGLAVVCGPADGTRFPVRRLHLSVVETERLTVCAGELLRRFPPIGRLLVGSGTGSSTLRKALASAFPHLPIETVNEHGSSARARARFVREIAAPGWRRLLPAGLRVPEQPYDDYVALLLAEEWFAGRLVKKE